MKQKRKSDVAVLLDYAGSHKRLTFLGLALSAVSMLLSMAPYICIWLAARDLIAVAPDWTEAQSVYTQPDRPKGRGMKLVASPVKEVAVPIWRPSARRPTSASRAWPM